MHIIEKAQYRNNSIIVYNQSLEPRKSSNRAENMAIVRAAAYSGLVTNGARKRIEKAIDVMIQTATTKKTILTQQKRTIKTTIAFVTLTIPDDAKACENRNITKECLEPFLLELRRKQKVKSYIWKAEYQKRGVLHYHLLINKFIAYTEIRQIWNKIIDKAGLMEVYKKQHGHNNANSTDIHAVHKIDNLAGYIAKYMCKTYQNEVSVKGKIWDCSDNIKRSKRYTLDVCGAWHERINELLKECKISIIKTDHCNIIKLAPEQIMSTMSLAQAQEFDRWKQDIINWDRKSQASLKQQQRKIEEKPTPTTSIVQNLFGQFHTKQKQKGQSAHGHCIIS